MKIIQCHLDGILLIEPTVRADERGFFLECYEQKRYREAGMLDEFVQDNHSRSGKGVLRGFHFTKIRPQAQIVTVMRGAIFDVVVDIRIKSPTFGEWFGTNLTDNGCRQIYMPHGFAHGFCVLSEYADLHYKVSGAYDPSDDGGLRWDDPDIGVQWPIGRPLISDRDRQHPYLKDIK